MENENKVTVDEKPSDNTDSKETDTKRDAEIERLKAALSKANSEAADWKRQFRGMQTEQERAEAERAEREKESAEELQTLRRRVAVSDFTAQYVSMGYETALATRAAEAMADGNYTDVIACQSAHIEAMKKQLEADALKKQPTLTSGTTPTAQQAEHEARNKERAWFGLPPI